MHPQHLTTLSERNFHSPALLNQCFAHSKQILDSKASTKTKAPKITWFPSPIAGYTLWTETVRMKLPLHLLVARLVNNSTLILHTLHQSMISTPLTKSTWTVSNPMSKLGTRQLVSTTESKANGPTAHQLMCLSMLVNLSSKTLGAL